MPLLKNTEKQSGKYFCYSKLFRSIFLLQGSYTNS